MRVTEALVWTDVQSGRDLPRRGFGGKHFAGALKCTNDLNPKSTSMGDCLFAGW